VQGRERIGLTVRSKETVEGGEDKRERSGGREVEGRVLKGRGESER